MRKPATLTAALISLVALSSVSEPAPEGAWAVYNVVSAVTRVDVVPVDRFTLTVGPAGVHDGTPGTWWELAAEKPDGARYAMRALSEGVPMLEVDAPGSILRYVLSERDEGPVEYVDAGTGLALLPQFDFARWFVPQPAATALCENGFATCGEYLGHGLSLERSGSGTAWLPWDDALILTLDPGLTIANDRNFKDAEGYRLTGRDYEYVTFDQADYDWLIGSGMNYFQVTPEQEELIRRRPVFYDMWPGPTFRYPETLCRSNYLGVVMLIDEPAIILAWNQHAYERVGRNVDMANVLRLRVQQQYDGSWHYGTYTLDARLRLHEYPLGLLRVREWDFPVWETRIQTACYQLEGGATGLVEEGRYDLGAFRKLLENLYGDAPELSPREMLLLHYAWLRGAARATGKDWGIAIYGQADPSISPLAVTLAYDMGARYIWFWTSDHDHHLPLVEQMELTRLLRAHEAAHPRPPREELLRAAEVAIAWPAGYTLDDLSMWHSPYLGLDRRNECGVSDREIITTAMFEALLLVKRGTDFDFIIDTPGAQPRGYRQVTRIGRDGRVRREGPR